MAVSTLFSTTRHLEIAQQTLHFLNAAPDYLTVSTAPSPRAVGDAIQRRLSENFQAFLGEDYTDFQAEFGARAIEDFAFRDRSGFYYAVDVKTHREDKKFSMPNLISVKRLAEFYGKASNYFALLLVHYRLEGIRPRITEVVFAPIEHLDWAGLTIGALGVGQIQIRKAGNLPLRRNYPRRQWMLELCERLIHFYQAEWDKATKRQLYFEQLKQHLEDADDPA